MPPAPSKKRILVAFLTRTFGGAEANGLVVARAVAGDTELEAHAAFPLVEDTAQLRDLFTAAGVTVHDYRVPGLPGPEWLKRPFFQLLGILSSLMMLRRTRPDMVYVVLAGPLACVPLRIACALRGIPVLGASQLTPAVEWEPLPRRVRLHRWLHRRGHLFVALCEHNRQWLKRAFGLEDDAVRLVYNGVPERYSSEEDQVCAREAVRKELGLPADSRILLTVGRLGIQKGHDLLLPIIDAIVDAFPEAHFVWLGEGDRRPEFEAARADMRHGDHLHLPGWRPDATPWLFGADLFVFPTYYEGLPRAVMEALSSGPPIVASAVSSIPEILDDGQCGRLVADNTPEAWRESLMFALSNPDEMAALCATARRRAPRFSEDRMVRETRALIHERLSS